MYNLTFHLKGDSDEQKDSKILFRLLRRRIFAKTKYLPPRSITMYCFPLLERLSLTLVEIV
jgi:hypothetical protein